MNNSLVDGDLTLWGRDDLNGRHETVGDDGDSEEQVDERQQVDHGTRGAVHRADVVNRVPGRQHYSRPTRSCRPRTHVLHLAAGGGGGGGIVSGHGGDGCHRQHDHDGQHP